MAELGTADAPARGFLQQWVYDCGGAWPRLADDLQPYIWQMSDAFIDELLRCIEHADGILLSPINARALAHSRNARRMATLVLLVVKRRRVPLPLELILHILQFITGC